MSVGVEFDCAKRKTNLAKHGFDLADGILLLSGPHLVEQARTVGDEQREQAIGEIGGRLATLIVVRRGDVTRFISLRRARDEERIRYRAVHGG